MITEDPDTLIDLDVACIKGKTIPSPRIEDEATGVPSHPHSPRNSQPADCCSGSWLWPFKGKEEPNDGEEIICTKEIATTRELRAKEELQRAAENK